MVEVYFCVSFKFNLPDVTIIQKIGKAYNELKEGEPAIERLFELIEFKPTVNF